MSEEEMFELIAAIRYRVTGAYAGDRDAVAAVSDIRALLGGEGI